MIFVISQSKLLQRAGLWIWHTSYGSTTLAFHRYIDQVISLIAALWSVFIVVSQLLLSVC